MERSHETSAVGWAALYEMQAKSNGEDFSLVELEIVLIGKSLAYI